MVYPAQRRMKIASPAIAGTGLLEKTNRTIRHSTDKTEYQQL